MKALRLPVLLLLLLSGACVRTISVREPAETPLHPEQVESMLMAGLSERVILAKADRSGVAPLSPGNLESLKAAGATGAMLERLIELERRPVVVQPRRHQSVHHAWCPYCSSHSCWGCWSYSSWSPSFWVTWGVPFHVSSYRVRRPGVSIRW